MNGGRRRLGVVWLVLGAGLLACRSGAGRERAGDEAYGAARYREALSAYQQAVKHDPVARIWAKVGAAALRVGELGVAVDAYLRLAGEDPTRAGEAAQGLEIAARGAERLGDDRALQAAVSGLEVVAPDRVDGRLALELARRPGSDPADLVRFLPAAVAGAPDPRVVDSLLDRYAAALWETRGCGTATPVYHAVIRRSRDPVLLRAANDGIAQCSDTLGMPDAAPPEVSPPEDAVPGASDSDSVADSTQ